MKVTYITLQNIRLLVHKTLFRWDSFSSYYVYVYKGFFHSHSFSLFFVMIIIVEDFNLFALNLEIKDVHLVTGLLKSYLRSLPGKISSFLSFPPLIIDRTFSLSSFPKLMFIILLSLLLLLLLLYLSSSFGSFRFIYQVY